MFKATWMGAAFILIVCAPQGGSPQERGTGEQDRRASQESPERSGAEPDRPRVALVLSGGGARAQAHVGVLEALEESDVPIDMIVGVSFGAIVGGLYSIGFSPDSVLSHLRRQDWDALLGDRIQRKHRSPEQRRRDERQLFSLPISGWLPSIPRGYIAGQKRGQLLKLLTWPAATIHDFSRLQIPFYPVTTDPETGETGPLQHGDLANALLGSSAFPLVFSPVGADGDTRVDAGAIRNLPAEDARALGADVLICSDVTVFEQAFDLLSPMEAAVHLVTLNSKRSLKDQWALCDVLIRPDVEGLSVFEFEGREMAVRRGLEAAREKLPEIHARVGRHPSAPRAMLPAPDSILIDSIAFEGISDIQGRLLKRMLGIRTPEWLSAADLDAFLDRAFAAEVFRLVTYRLDVEEGPAGKKTLLILQGSEPIEGNLRFGMRYESEYGSSLLFSADFANFLQTGSALLLDVRLGQQLQFSATVSRRLGGSKDLMTSLGARYRRLVFHRFTEIVEAGEEGPGEGGDIDSPSSDASSIRAGVRLWSGTAYLGAALGSVGAMGIEVKGEHGEDDRSISSVSCICGPRTYMSIAGVLEMDSRNRKILPEQGLFLNARGEVADRRLGSGADFTQLSVRAEGYWPLSSRITGLARAHLGWSRGPDLPRYYRFSLGGAYAYHLLPDQEAPFMGVAQHTWRGRGLELFGLGAQVRIWRTLFALVQWNAARLNEEEAWGSGDWRSGLGTSLAARTRGGLLSATLSKAPGRPSRLEFDFGFPF